MALFGTNDKLALEVVVVLASLAFGAGLGVLARPPVRGSRRRASRRSAWSGSWRRSATRSPTRPWSRPDGRVRRARGADPVLAPGAGPVDDRRAAVSRRHDRTRPAARSSCGPARSGSAALVAGIGGRSLLDRFADRADRGRRTAAGIGDGAAAGGGRRPGPDDARPDADRRPQRPVLSHRHRPAGPERRRRDLDAADPRPGRARDDPDLGRAAGPADVRAVRDDRLRQQRGRRRPRRERQVDRRPAARRARHRRRLVVGDAARRAGRSTASPPACRRPGSWTRRASR